MTPQPQSETELIERANRGEEEALAEIYRRHGGWVLSLASRFTDRRDEAHDVLQDVFTYFLRQFPGFRLSSTLRAYLYPIVKHVAISRGRKSSRLVSLAEWKDDGRQRPGWAKSTPARPSCCAGPRRRRRNAACRSTSTPPKAWWSSAR